MSLIRRSAFAAFSSLGFALCMTGCHGGGGGDTPATDSGTGHSTSQTTTDAGHAPSASPDAGATSQPQPTSDAATDAAASSDPTASMTDYAAWQAAIGKLRDCKVFDSGDYPYVSGWDLRCEALCIVAASCADLQSENCSQVTVPKLESCEDACPDDETFSCGDGTAVSVDVVCDLNRDCASGEDEKHCDPFSCSDGTQHVGADERCDGEADCDDGSDEKKCVLVCGTPYAQT